MTPMTSMQRAALQGWAALLALQRLEVEMARTGERPDDLLDMAFRAREVAGTLGYMVTHERARRSHLSR